MRLDVLNDAERELAAESFLFRGIPPEELNRRLSDDRCVRAHISRGTVIYDPQAFRRCLGLLLSGQVMVSKRELIVSILGQGELFGAAALFNSRDDYVTTLTARSDCDILFFAQELIEEFLAGCPAAALNYIAYLSGRIRFLNGKIEGLIAGSAEQKLAQYLLGKSEENRIDLPCPVSDLAKRLHISRASLYRAFDALEEAGAAVKRGRTIWIVNLKALEQLS